MNNQDKQEHEVNLDGLDDALNDMDNKLNLTCEDKDEDDDLDPQLEKEYMDFMSSLNKEMGGSDGDAVQQLTSLMGNLFQNLAKEQGSGEAGENQKSGENEQKEELFDDLLKDFDKNPELDKISNALLGEILNKEFLLEPMTEAQENYTKFLQEKGSELNEPEKSNYQNQLRVIQEILNLLNTQPDNKSKLIELFEQMQQYGDPPAGISSTLEKDNVFANLFNTGKNNDQKIDPKLLNDCRIF